MSRNREAIEEEVAEHIRCSDTGEAWFIKPVRIQWNCRREEWQYWINGERQGHDDLEDILKECGHQALIEFYHGEVA